ncbi:MAG: inositol monophosphatase [Saprospiraceae bacterium]|nr:MAG: inositol monophosphatase [Saprospiraceae bacterium]
MHHILCRRTCQLVEEVADFIRHELGKVSREQITDKSLNSLVSYVDKTAEEQLVTGLRQLLPGSVFLTEENTVGKEQGEFQWVVDPLDGTTNFLHQLPCFAVSVALRRGEQTILGIVNEVNRRECFYAWKGGGAFLNDQEIHVSQTEKLHDSLVATGFPYRDFERLTSYFAAFEYFMKNTQGLRRFGAAAVDLAWVACGRFDAFFEYGLSPWDLAAGALIVQEAGGNVSDFRRGSNYLFGEELVAANPAVYGEVMAAVEAAFSPQDKA